jgi:hypothetical protein
MDELSTTHARPSSAKVLGAEATAQSVVCPCCNARLPFRRSEMPAIDACGFESYRLDCEACGMTFAGVIDPADEALVLSATPA